MGPENPLPLHEDWKDVDEYVDSLLAFATSSEVFRNVCGGIHILDFLTREPDLYSTVLPADWRAWFEEREIGDILDLLLREDVRILASDQVSEWRNHQVPPPSLLEFIQNVRKHSLKRDFAPPLTASDGTSSSIPRQITVGMNPKKTHEVENFVRFVDRLSSDLGSRSGGDEAINPIIVDFGSGQNYLGRILASSPHEKHIFAVERKHENIFGARGMDVAAKVAKKEKVMRNKKEFAKLKSVYGEKRAREAVNQENIDAMAPKATFETNSRAVTIQEKGSHGSITYIEHEIKDGDLSFLLDYYKGHLSGSSTDCSRGTSLVVSLHSCGNLSNHGIRSLIMNPSVIGIAIIGCCYNLMTERLGPATYKFPTLRPYHPRLETTSKAHDPHGFPMSKRLELYPHTFGQGIRLNITARMMAVQAPYNWGAVDSEAFFTRHFYRALLQRILLDSGIVNNPSDPGDLVGVGPAGTNVSATPLIVGSLGKHCFTSFKAYVRGAINRLSGDPTYGPAIRERLSDLSDEDIERYEERFWHHKKKLSIIWSLMAFAASLVESIIVVDRWLYLKEQDCVKDCWVEAVFDYAHSPRNLVVVGVKKRVMFFKLRLRSFTVMEDLTIKIPHISDMDFDRPQTPPTRTPPRTINTHFFTIQPQGAFLLFIATGINPWYLGCCQPPVRSLNGKIILAMSTLKLHGPRGSEIVVHPDVLAESPFLRQLAEVSPIATFDRDFKTDPRPISEYLESKYFFPYWIDRHERAGELHIAYDVARDFELNDLADGLAEDSKDLLGTVGLSGNAFAVPEFVYSGVRPPGDSYRTLFKQIAKKSFLERSRETWSYLAQETTVGISTAFAFDVFTALRNAIDQAARYLDKLNCNQDYIQYSLVHKRAPSEGFTTYEASESYQDDGANTAIRNGAAETSDIIRNLMDTLIQIKDELEEATEKMDHTMVVLQVPYFRRGE